MTIKYIDLFAGVGGFRVGINKAHPNWECVYSNEYDKYANSVYKKHYERCDDRDIRTVPTSDIPDHDLLVGGFPCQAFSVAGKRGGFNDTRGTLFFEIARILRDKRPRYLLLENVKGLLSHDNGKTFQTILGVLSDIGYECQWQVLNSKDFGVPQNRERVFIVGHLRGERRPEVFPLSGEIKTTTKELELVGNCNPSGRGQSGGVYSTSGLHPTIGAGGGNPNRKRDIGWSSGYITQLNQPTHSNDRVYASDGISQTLNTMQGGNRQPFIAEDVRIRRLTPIECERLQGFPDNWTKYGHDNKEISDTQRYKMMGNAVSTPVVSAIISRLCDIM